MTTDSTLIEKREELKRRLAAGEYKTLVDVFLNWVNRAIQKITRQSKPFPLWLITILLSLVVNLIVFMASYITGGMISIRNSVESFGLGYGLGILTTISTYVFSIATIIVINQSIRRIFVLWRDNILDATESISSLQAFEDWVEKVCNRRLHILVSIILCSSFILIAVDLTSTLLRLWFSNGFTFGFIILYLINGAICYQLVMIILLPTMLHRYDLKLFAADPASSELLSRLSNELIFFVYFIAIFSAFFSLAFVALGVIQAIGIFVALFLWLPIITMFALNQTSLSSIVRRAKWKTLNEIQAKVEKIQSAENLEAKETMDTINRLLDYHERVNKTRNSAVDLRTILGFINSLLLPVPAFLLDKVLPLFTVKR